MLELFRLTNEQLVEMICGIDCKDNPYITIPQVKEEILSRLKSIVKLATIERKE